MREILIDKTVEYTTAKVVNRRQLLSLDSAWLSDRSPERAADYWIRISRNAMACRFEVIVASENDHGILAAQECLDEVDRLESILTIFRPESEASLLNREANVHPVQVGAELYELLQFCERMYRETEGAFDITSGVLSECWGFKERKPRVPAPEDLRAARERVGFHFVSLGEGRAVSFHSRGLRINFGGVGKGYALDRGASSLRLRGIGNAMLSAGCSSVLALGDGPEGTGWLVGLRHPVFKNRRLGTVRLRSCSMATSGQEEQSFEVDGQRYGHILDPRTGFPAKGVASVSVIADSTARADSLSTAFFIGGAELAKRYCDRHEGVVAVMLEAHDLSHPIVIGSSDRVSVEIVND
jgi:thiamine biosynthesis lipoprotein